MTRQWITAHHITDISKHHSTYHITESQASANITVHITSQTVITTYRTPVYNSKV